MTSILLTRPMKTPVIFFLMLTALAVIATLAQRMGMIGVAEASRSVGFIVGFMVIVTGNFLPKMRPLASGSNDPAKASMAERFAGWALVLTGFAYATMFLFAPLDTARRYTAVAGIITLVVIALDWTAFALRARKSALSFERSEESSERRRLSIVFLLAGGYVLATACLTYLVPGKGWSDQVTTVGFWMFFAIFFAVMYHRPSTK